MSWFDSSFSFAKTALSQAQKSIDKVLDIKEGHDASNAAPSSGKAEPKEFAHVAVRCALIGNFNVWSCIPPYPCSSCEHFSVGFASD